MTAFDYRHGGLCNTVDRHEHDYFHFLVDLTDAVIATRDIPSLAEKTADYLHAFFGLDFISLETVESSTFRLNAHSFAFDRQNRRTCNCYSKSLHATLLGTALRNHEKILFNRKAMLEHAGKYPFIDTLVKKGLQVLLHLPLVSAGELLGALAIGSVRHSHFTPDVMELLNRVSSMLAMAIDVILLHGNGNSCSTLPLPADSSPVEQDASLHPHNIIGNSPAIQSILRQIEIVAPCNATVLLQGETGTGKGLVAQTIHDLSERNMHEMVKMNCTAIPSELMESELFGHEKGAFTGALNRRIGHFEQADKSTLFLDEIGDMPLDLQPKLLSVLQEHQIRRLGSVVTLPVDVRFIAATNCNLAQKIEDKTFRSDLFYRLNVFPITIPPLRERAEDIPLLARFFVRKYARQMNRHITTIPEPILDMMSRLPWPGNIRELENVMERAVILTGNSTVLNLSPESLSGFTTRTFPVTVQTPEPIRIPAPVIPQTDRNAIIRALRETGGQIGGKSGAAARLGLKRTTLLARIKRLGIAVDDFRGKEEMPSTVTETA